MNEMDRRAFIKALGAGAGMAMLPASIQRALAIPAYSATGTIRDAEHVVILLQENRSISGGRSPARHTICPSMARTGGTVSTNARWQRRPRISSSRRTRIPTTMRCGSQFRIAGDPYQRRLAGHIENGRDSFTDPAMGNPSSVPG
jgi:hypothetical protein